MVASWQANGASCDFLRVLVPLNEDIRSIKFGAHAVRTQTSVSGCRRMPRHLYDELVSGVRRTLEFYGCVSRLGNYQYVVSTGQMTTSGVPGSGVSACTYRRSIARVSILKFAVKFFLTVRFEMKDIWHTASDETCRRNYACCGLELTRKSYQRCRCDLQVIPRQH